MQKGREGKEVMEDEVTSVASKGDAKEIVDPAWKSQDVFMADPLAARHKTSMVCRYGTPNAPSQ